MVTVLPLAWRARLADGNPDEHMLVPLLNPGSGRRRHQIVTPIVAHDRNLTSTETLAQRPVNRDPANLGAVDETIGLPLFRDGKPALFDELLDLSQPRLFFGLLLSLSVERLVPRDFRPLPARSFRRRRHCSGARRISRWPAFLPLLLALGFVSLLFTDQARFQQLITQ